MSMEQLDLPSALVAPQVPINEKRDKERESGRETEQKKSPCQMK